MIEAIQQTGQEQGRFAVSRFIPLLRLMDILENVPGSGVDAYITNNFRILLSGSGVNFDLPWHHRPVDHVFRRTLIRRAAVAVSLQPREARFVVIETDSLHKNVQPGRLLPNDPFDADIRIWLLGKDRKRGLDKPWRLEIDDLPNIGETSIVLKKYGNAGTIEIENNYDISGESYGDIAVSILRNWSGLH